MSHDISWIIQRIKACVNRLMLKNKPRTLMLWGTGALVCLTVIFVMIGLIPELGKLHQVSASPHISTTHDEARDQTMHKQFDALSMTLSHIERTLSEKRSVVNVESLRKELARARGQATALAKQSNQLITQAIAKSTAQLNTRLETITQQLKMLQEKGKKIVFVHPSTLPFKVISINNIQQNDIVTIRYNHTTWPLNIGDYLAGWRLIHADFSAQRAEFVNQQKQHVMISLNRNDVHAISRSPSL